jgi:sugar phosphate isomerase/epimerase
MDRRTFLATTLTAPLLTARNRIDMSRIAVLTDECAKSPADAIAFAKQYGLRWVELRGIPGGKGSYYAMKEPDLRQAAREFKDAGLQVSFVNTDMLKFGLPGTEPVRRSPETPEARTKRLAREQQRFERRIEDLKSALLAAKIFGVRGVRVFTFSRVEDPLALLPKVAGLLNEMGAIAKKEGVQLMIENEGSQNVATSAELAAIMKLVDKSIGINWDPLNSYSREKALFPEGYKLLPFKRIGNVQIKARGLVVGPESMPWLEIMRQLAKDGYKRRLGLETHIFDGTLIEKAHLAMKELQKLTAQLG